MVTLGHAGADDCSFRIIPNRPLLNRYEQQVIQLMCDLLKLRKVSLKRRHMIVSTMEIVERDAFLPWLRLEIVISMPLNQCYSHQSSALIPVLLYTLYIRNMDILGL